MNDASPAPPTKSARRVLWRVVKWSLCAAVLYFVGIRAWDLWQQGREQPVQIEMGWIALSAVAYLAGWIPSIWFWRRMMQAMGGNVSWLAVSRAYYCGHLGKYIPGKAMVLIIRGALVKDHGCRVGPATLSAAVETLMMMASGALIAVALSPLLLNDRLRESFPSWLRSASEWPWLRAILEHRLLAPLSVLIATAALLPLFAKMLTRLALKITPVDDRNGGLEISARLIGSGLLAYVASWLILGLSLGLTLRGLGAETAFSLSDLLLWTAAFAISTAIGFAVLFSPGGLGVREGLIIAILSHQAGITPQQAVAAAVVSRLVALAAEIVSSAALYYGVRGSRLSSPRETPPESSA